MIVSASYRTDIPAFYGDWFSRRLAAGRVDVVNPYGGPAYGVSLAPDAVDGFVFWTRNVGPFLPTLRSVAATWPFVVQFTITGYPRALEAAVTSPDRAVSQVRELAASYGGSAVVWRYDPILMTSLTPPSWHRETFARLARSLSGVTDEVVVSFAEIYRKTRTNLASAARRDEFTWHDPSLDEKRALIVQLHETAADHGMALTLCTQPALDVPETAPARCVDPARLSAVAGRPIRARTKGNRPGCLCAESRDIGAYDTCPHGCVYCYAVQHRDKARRAFKAHDPAAVTLGLKLSAAGVT